MKQRPASKPDAKTERQTSVSRTEERFAHLLDNPESNLSKPKRAKLLLLLKEFKAKQKEATNSTLARINKNLERIVGRERIKMMKGMLEKNHKALRRGDLTELPRLFTLLKSDRVPLRYGKLSVYRLGNKLFMKSPSGSFTFDFKVSKGGKWEMWHKGTKIQKHSATKNSPLSGLFDKVGESNGDFYCRMQEALTAQVPKEEPKLKKGKEQVVATKLMKDLYKFMNSTGSSAGPLPASLIARIKKLSKTPSVIEGSVAEGENVLKYGVYVRSAVVKGRKIYQLSVQERDDKVGVRSEQVRYWPLESNAFDAKFGKTKAQARYATKFTPKPKIGPARTKAKARKKAYAEYLKKWRKSQPGTSPATAKLFKGPKQKGSVEKRYVATLLREAKSLVGEVNTYQKLSKFSKNLISEAKQRRVIEEGKEWNNKDTTKITNKVVQYRQILQTAVRKLESGEGTLASMRQSLSRAHAVLPTTPTKQRLARRVKGLPKAPTKTA